MYYPRMADHEMLEACRTAFHYCISMARITEWPQSKTVWLEYAAANRRVIGELKRVNSIIEPVDFTKPVKLSGEFAEFD